MASLCNAMLVRSVGRLFAPSRAAFPAVRNYAEKVMADPMEHATGLEKRELLAVESGNADPFTSVCKRGAGTKDTPNLIYSAFDSRIVGCVCDEDSASINWMWVHKDQPRRCGCGHWFKLVEKDPI